MPYNSNYLAHIQHENEETPREQTLLSHLQGTAELAGRFAAAFGHEELGRLCGAAHDIGKYSKEFQARIRGIDTKVDHSTAGSKELIQLRQPQAALCVAGHHGGIPDLGSQSDGADQPTLLGRWKRDVPDYAAWRSEWTLPPAKPYSPADVHSNAMLTRMLYSCLVDADFLDTERFMSGGAVVRQGGEPLKVLLKKLEHYIEDKGYLHSQGDVGELRSSVLSHCMEGGKDASGLFSLTVPTGGGKTIASLAFALRHAVRYGMDRVIYVIPYCSIIDQTAEKFREIFGKDSVLEHHSGVRYETGEDGILSPKDEQMALASENWDMPLVVTTSVQFFESLYGNRPSACRKLHNIANSVVVFDEAQMLPLSCLLPCVSAIGLLCQHFRVTALLCSATQPALDPLFSRLSPGLTRKELFPDTESLYSALRRVTFHHIGKISDQQLADSIQSHKQALLIVNTRKQAQQVYAKLTGEGNIHLSTLMIPAGRQKLIEEIRMRLREGRECRVVSTSLIEAGVDVDFPAVYRAEAGLDSILQAAGRCNREGSRSAQESIVTIFTPEHAPPPLMKPNIGIMNELLPLYDIGSPQAVHAYFTALLALSGQQDLHNVLDAFERGIDGRVYPFKTVAERFHLINTPTKTIYIPTGEGKALIERLQQGESNRALYRDAGQYAVSVYPRHFDSLHSAGDIQLIAEDMAILMNPSLYNERTGLSLEADEGKALFG